MTDLTEQWKKGELPYAEYYIKLAGGEYTNDVWDVGGWQSFNKKGDVVDKVLAPVPSYDEWKEYQELDEENKKNVQLAIRFSIEAEILKELLKECKQWFDWYHIDTGIGKEYIESWHEKGHKIHKQLDEALK